MELRNKIELVDVLFLLFFFIPTILFLYFLFLFFYALPLLLLLYIGRQVRVHVVESCRNTSISHYYYFFLYPPFHFFFFFFYLVMKQLCITVRDINDRPVVYNTYVHLSRNVSIIYR